VRYISSRGDASALSFDEVLLSGLARDGGLYIPESWPHFDAAALRDMASLSYVELAVHLTHPFVGKAISESTYGDLVAKSYAGFDHDPIAPLRDLGDGVHLMELFHGPTLAFKDYALQLVGQLFNHVLESRGERATILGATSGDTGSAAIAGCAACSSVDIFMLHPKDRISDVQRRQMTTVAASNVFNIAIEGDFDDCQDMVKTLFSDTAFRNDMRLSAANSINWARIMAQTVYYFSAALELGAPDKEVSFAVPTGNFGNVYAGYVARCMGLPIKRLIIGSNHNDILTRFFDSGAMEVHEVTPSLSPSMDIQFSSNFERLLFDLYDRNGTRVASAMKKFRKSSQLKLETKLFRTVCDLFVARRLDDEGTLATIAREYKKTGVLLDPHSAVGVHAARQLGDGKAGAPVVALATAHPAKFPEAVEKATGTRPQVPLALAGLKGLPEYFEVLPTNLDAIAGYMRDHAAIMNGDAKGSAREENEKHGKVSL
jgi:threonine synthase